jgi:amino acid adenylation domain-containing protein
MESLSAALSDLLCDVLPQPARRQVTLRKQGLDSIATARLWLELQARFGVELPFEWLATYADPEELLLRIATQRVGDATPRWEIQRDPENRYRPFPLTPIQESYVMGKQPDLTTDPVGCQQYIEFEVDGLDVERLLRAWLRLVEQHEMLRARITADGMQRIAESASPFTIAVHENADIEAVRARLMNRCCESGEWPLFTIEVSLPKTVHLNIDMLTTDGHGLAVLLEQWRACYDDAAFVLPEADISVRDCVIALRALSRTDAHQKDLDAWMETLRDLPPGPAVTARGSKRRSLEGKLSAEEWCALREKAEALHVSPTAIVLSLFARALGRQPVSLIVTTNMRAWLPAGSEHLVGPFTSSAVIVAGEDPAAVQQRLWDAMQHSSVSGVTVLRQLRGRERLSVVFTSLVGVGPGGRQDGGFGADVTSSICRTSEVALEHQIWEHGDELRYRWDVTCDAETMFASFENSLRAFCNGPGKVTHRPLNDLQQAYYVARVSAPDAAWNGCQIYKSFEVEDFDARALECSLLSMIERHEALRTVVTLDGRLAIRSYVPDRWSIAVADAEDVAAIRDEMTGRGFPLGAWPPFDVRVTRQDRRYAVHCAFDLAVVDARSVHLLCRELFGPVRESRPSPLPSPRTEEGTELYWEERLAQIPPGPNLTPGANRKRIRLEGRLPRSLPDAVLLGAFLDVLGTHVCDRAFTVPVVRFPESAERGEHTALSWIEHDTAYERLLDADAAAGATSGLRALRRRVMRERGKGEFAFPIVYTSVIDLTAAPLPPNVRPAQWLSCTPDVSLDCIGIRDSNDFFFCWDAVEADFAPGLLATMFDDYRARIEKLAERDRILYDWNDTATAFPADRLMHQLFEDRAAERPDAIALRGHAWKRTYAELNREAHRIAHALGEQGVRPETIVGVAMRREPAMVAACFGILKAGGAYLPVDPSLPTDRAAMLLSEARASILLTTKASPVWNTPPGIRVIDVDTLAGDDDAQNLAPIACPENLAYVIFTSGSTGKPKGVAVAHRAVLNLLQWCNRTFGFGPDDIGLCVSSLGFDLSVFDLFGILGSGGTLYLADETERMDPQLLLDIVLRERITFWSSAPAVLSQLAPLLPAVRGDALRLVFLSGDHTPLSLPNDLRTAFPNARLINLGGATEATVWSNYFPVETLDPAWRSIPYGKPIDNARYHVLDERLEPCAVGVEGDLYIGGECLSLGYYRHPALTAERFLPDPFSRQPGQRLYRTGDRASYFADGNLCFLGRLDGQTKIRGFRIETGEIEHRLREHRAIKDAVVLVRTDPSGDRKLVAYVIAATPPRPDIKELRAFVAQTLPDYMIPNFVAFVDTFPATSNGKLDRDALPWPIVEERATAMPRVAAIEDEISALFAKLLGVPRFDASQDMWSQGATSFTVVQVSNALQERYGRRIPVSAVLAEPTVAGIAKWLEESTPPVQETAPEAVDFFNEDERRRFKEGHWNVRPLSKSEPLIPLRAAPVADAHYAWRSSRRDLLDEPVPYASFCRLLGLLAEATIDVRTRRLYPSAGDTFAVQVYLHVREGRVEGVEPGVYYYRSAEHALQLVRARAELDRDIHFYYNRPLFDAAAFEIYLIGQTKGIEPVYRENADRYLDLEAGHISQLLMMGQAACGIGLCPIGDVAFAKVREPLGLDSGHRFLLSMLGGRASTALSTRVAPPFADRKPAEIAVIGIAGRFPGADDPDALWRQLIDGEQAIQVAPPERNLGEIQAGFLDRIDEFDSQLFNISPAEAETLDPQLRLLLETVWACLENAGHSPASLRGAAGRVGVVIGAMWQDYQQVGAEAWERGGEAVISAAGSDIANRISQFFDFQGPSLAVDAACTSSLAALHLAAESIRRGECGAVIVGAVNLLAHPYHLGLLSGLGLAATNVTGAYDADSSGWVPGEGVCAVLLRPLDAAVADADVIHGVIEATAVGHAGRLGAPELKHSIARLLADHHLAPRDVSYVECAAAGASVADAAEIDALANVFADVRFGTLKANIGHLEAAAGLSQLMKVLLQMRHGRIAPTKVAARCNPLVPWHELNVRLADRAADWDASPRRALINALGANGAYAHVVVRAAPPRKVIERRDERQVIALAAASREQLIVVAQRLREHLVSSSEDLADVAFTLQTGRVELAHRVAIPCSTIDELIASLDDFLRGKSFDTKLPNEAWDRPARRVSLPTYPFVRKKHWATAPKRPTPDAQLPISVDALVQMYAEVSGIAREELDARLPLEQYGLSSLLVARMNARLERELGSVPRTLFYEHRTLVEIAERLGGTPHSPSAPSPLSGEKAEMTALRAEIAIIGIAGRYPQARDLESFWGNLVSGRDCITPLPAERRQEKWPVERMWGGYLDDVDRFDSLLFNITSREADLTDPQERIFLETVWEALDDAGYPRQRLRERHASRVGVWVGAMYNDYPFFGVEKSLGGEAVSSGAGLADIANRVSYYFDLRGPSMTVDTLCSSSLTGIHLAVESLRRGECEVAIAGGVNLSLHPNKFIEQARHEMPSSDHRCRSFGEGGDGFVPGEGAGAVILKPLRAAIADGDRIHAVIKGTAVNHGGRTNGYMVPNPVAQAELIRTALASANAAADSIGYIEAHGTGTELGDPIEVNGLERAFAGSSASWPIGSVKSSIGHLEGAAGIASLTKVVLQLREKKLVPSLHAEKLNPNIDWQRSPFRVQREVSDWVGPLPRRAGISSFGAGGANAHAIVEEYIMTPSAKIAGPQLIVLSARDEEGLRAMFEVLIAFLERHPLPLADVAYTLQVGREPLRERMAMVVSDATELRNAAVIRGRVSPTTDGVETTDLAAAARAWVNGSAIDWSKLHGVARPNLVSLPSYPFARRRHWLPWTSQLTTPVSRKTWTLADDAATTRIDGRALCIFNDDTAALANQLAERLGRDRMTLVRAGSRVEETRTNIWIDLCDLGEPSPWHERLAMLQRFLAARPNARILHVSRGLQDCEGAAPSLAGAQLAGVIRMLRAEHRNVIATTIDIDADDPARDIIAELLRSDAAEVCYRGGRRYRPELTAIRLPAAELRLDPEKVYLVTGGTRGIGARVAQRLSERGARHIAVMGLHPQQTSSAMVHCGPLTARADVDAFLARLRGIGAIGGIVHCAGRLSDDRRPFIHRNLDEWRAVFEPKVEGLQVLAELCSRDRPDFFVLFSSVAGSFPALGAGAADYAAANAFMDFFASHQSRINKPWFRSVAWPSWRGVGASQPEPPAYAQLGLGGLEAEDGLRLLEAVIANPSGGSLIAGRAETRFLEMTREARSTVPPWLTTLFAETLGTAPSDLAPDILFGDLGVESLLLTELLQKIEKKLGRPLEPTLLLDHPTLASLSAALANASVPPADAGAPEHDQRIAVIGMSCRFPGAPDLDTFWTNLREGRCAVGEVPSSRWDPGLYPTRSISKWGGFVEGIEEFDPAYFSMTDEEAICLDPAIRLILEGVENCLADAGYEPRELSGRDIGVFAGARVSDYWRRTGTRSGTAGFGSDQNFIAARVAHHLDLTGPCFVVDSACSSSLVSVQLAARSLLAGESELAFAAGVDVLLDERPYVEFSAARALSPSGRCRVFDEHADGFVPGEGCGVLLLKRLDRALQDGDRIHAVIEAVAVNNDGRTVGLTTPNPTAQAAVILRALERSGLNVEDIAMVEAHGTGTMLGDPMELRALTDAFAKHTTRTNLCAVGSVKSNLGHLLSAAGIAGLIKVVLSLEHGEIPPTLFCERPNPRFDFARSPLYPNVTLRSWPADRTVRAAGVSAFGLGGTNAHLIATAHPPSNTKRAPLPRLVFHRRRLWLDREAREETAELVASILDLQFVG